MTTAARHPATLLAVPLLLLTTACATQPERAGTPPPQPSAIPAPAASTTPAPCLRANSPPDREDLVGMPLDEVRVLEKGKGHRVRIICRDGHALDATDDLDRNRVDVTVEDDVVTSAHTG